MQDFPGSLTPFAKTAMRKKDLKVSEMNAEARVRGEDIAPSNSSAAKRDLEIKAPSKRTSIEHRHRTQHRSLGAPTYSDEVKSAPSGSIIQTTGLTGNDEAPPLGVLEADLLSHLILRLCFSGNRAKEDWLIEQECRLTSLKLCMWASMVSSSMFETNDRYELQWSQKFEHLFKALGIPHTIAVATPDIVALDPDVLKANTPLLKCGLCPEVAFLIKSRRCVVAGGDIHVNILRDAHTLILSRFAQSLRGALAGSSHTATKIHLAARGTPLQGLFEKLRTYDPIAASRLIVKSNSKTVERLTPEMISKYIQTSFPLCMVQLMSAARSQRHLKHAGRLQLWLFLKDAGLTCEEQVALFRQLWSDAQKFEKEHMYTLRHMYGLEGKREQKSCYSCSKILGPSVPPPRAGEYHGCPFRDWSWETLRQCLSQYALKGSEIEEVIELKKNREYELACRCVYERLHPGEDGGDVGLSPINFYAASRRYWARQAVMR